MAAVIDRIDSALDMTTGVVAGISPDQLAAPSLCAGWDVRTELNHLVGGMCIFAAELAGTGASADHDADWLGASPREAFTAAAALDRAAWHRPDALDTAVQLSFGSVPGPMAALIHLTEVLVHGVDLAVATGQEDRIDQHRCEQLLASMHGMDFDIFRRPGMFDAELPAPADAPAHQRMLAYLGRDLHSC